MKSFLEKHKFLFLLLLIFLISEILVDPRGNFPLNDDWSYSKSVLNWQRDGVYNIGDWPAMTLFTHLLWGLAFTKIAGFSFFILRISTLVSSLIGVVVLFSLVKKISNSAGIAFIGSMALSYNPIYFNLSNTYMTDITFNTLLVLGCYFAYDFFRNGNILSFVLVFISSIFLVLTRQFGIVVPIAFTLCCLSISRKKVVFIVTALILTGATLLVLRLYEDYLHQILPPGSAYKYSGNSNPLLATFWDALFVHIRDRHATFLLHFMVYTLPFSIIFFIPLIRSLKAWIKVLVALFAAAITYFIFKTEPFPMGNVFVNVGVGTRTFYEYLSTNTTSALEHASSQKFEDSMYWVKLFLITINMVIIIFGMMKMRPVWIKFPKADSALLFFVALAVTYSLMLLITESYFDRYHIPLITVGIILFSYFSKIIEPRYGAAILVLIILFYVSVAGTKDYFKINTIRWEAYHHLIKEKKVEPEKINGGFEVNCWNEGRYSFWYTFLDIKGFDYLIQFWQEPGFKPYKEYEFQRYFPFEKDKIFIFARDSISTGS